MHKSFSLEKELGMDRIINLSDIRGRTKPDTKFDIRPIHCHFSRPKNWIIMDNYTARYWISGQISGQIPDIKRPDFQQYRISVS